MVATATSSCMIHFTSIASVTSFSIFGLIPWDYATVCLVVGFFPTLLGNSLMKRARKAGAMLSAVGMTIQYIFSIVTYDEEDQTGICEGYKSRAV